LGLLSDADNKELTFFENKEHPGGNSYYRENTEFSLDATFLFNDSHKVNKRSITLDTVIKQKGFPLPDLIKMDVQGAELDVLKGASETLKYCKHLILELQHVEYNTGAPLKNEVVEYLKSLGFLLANTMMLMHTQGDYHFIRINT
jgi:hypothetical protein